MMVSVGKRLFPRENTVSIEKIVLVEKTIYISLLTVETNIVSVEKDCISRKNIVSFKERLFQLKRDDFS